MRLYNTQQNPLLPVVFVAITLFGVHCASVPAGSVEQGSVLPVAAAEVAPDRSPDKFEDKFEEQIDGRAEEPVADPESDPGLVELIGKIEKTTAKAEVAYRSGDEATAKLRFQECLGLILDSPYDIVATPDLRDAFEVVVRKINDTDLTFFPEPEPTPESEKGTVQKELSKVPTSTRPKNAVKKIEELEPIVEALPHDIPMVVNERVLYWIDLYQGRLRDQFEEGLKNSGRFLPMIRKVFREENLPLDLAYMAHVESSFKPRAYSRARAMGVWQFILSTGRMYGLQRTDWVDDRANPEKATRAAARHLKDLYDEFGDWYLVMAAYNAGQGKVSYAIRRARSRDFWVLARSRYLRRETKNYVPAFLATTMISKDPKSYGFNVKPAPPWEYDLAGVATQTDLRVIAKCAGRELDEIKALNPELRWLTTPPGSSEYQIRLPKGTRKTFVKSYAELPEGERVLWVRHRVRRGETLSIIAKRYGTTVRGIQSANGIRNRHRISQGAVLLIPVGPGLSASSPQVASGYKAGQRIRHRVRRGESLSRIARKYRTDIDSLCAWNQLNRNSVIYSGERLTVYYSVKAEDIASAASAGETGKQKVVHRVRRGDTLTGIANLYRTTLRDLCQWNGISRKKTLYPGDTLIVYINR